MKGPILDAWGLVSHRSETDKTLKPSFNLVLFSTWTSDVQVGNGGGCGVRG